MAWTAPRTWVSGDVLTAAQLNTDVRDNMGVLSTALLIPTFITGQIYGSQGANGMVAQATSANVLRAVPITVPNTVTVTSLKLYISSLAAGNIRLGIYNDNVGVPGSLVKDAGTIDTGTTGIKSVATSQVLTGPAKYWLAGVGNAAPTYYAYNGNSLLSSDTLAFNAGVYRAFTYAALPDPFGAIAGYLAVPPAIHIGV